ncbi:hypothetical protein DFR70_101400 [Nocardia tenerifensis]|uniref:Uncharacterized protein n=1 Tax=Nocardia tenerifensis TaxID=228006 RepID=A0A318KDW8_9NOCA|nr:hypothetical protein [Nocardia tenerifensis]PXX70979.1 hypothetical protein DFR70_101400 [Nocardia tenerifensis]
MSEEYGADRADVTDDVPRRKGILATLAAIVMGTAILGFVLPVAIWPGEARLTAPLFCSAPYTEPIVVSDTVHDSEGQSTNFSMYCVGERGQYTEEGFLLPWLALWALHSAIVIGVVIVVRAWGRWRPDRPTEPVRLAESTEL